MAKTVILIDDDEEDLEVMKEAINEIDNSILSVCYTNPAEAIHAILNELIFCPDYIFIDINMAPFTGDECLKQLRKFPGLGNTKIGMLSTSIPKSEVQALMDAGANFAFQKPDNFRDYRVLLKRVFFENL